MITRRILRLSGASTPGMLFRDNPVLTRELLVTLRSPRSFVLQLLYVCALGALVYFYWPAGEEGARQVSPGVARPFSTSSSSGSFFWWP